MGTPDMLGTYGTYQYFAEDGPPKPARRRRGGKRSRLTFENETARARDRRARRTACSRTRRRSTIEFLVHRDRDANAAVIEIQGRRIVLKAGQWSRWTKLDFELSMPAFLPSSSVSGICRFYLQEVAPNFRLYVSPINMDPAAPRRRSRSRESFVQDVSGKLGPFYTTGFQEDHKARTNGIFSDDEYARQAGMVLEERLALLDYAIEQLRGRPAVLLLLQQRPPVAHVLVGLGRQAPDPLRPRGEEVLRPRPAALPEARRGDRRADRPLRQRRPRSS